MQWLAIKCFCLAVGDERHPHRSDSAFTAAKSWFGRKFDWSFLRLPPTPEHEKPDPSRAAKDGE